MPDDKPNAARRAAKRQTHDPNHRPPPLGEQLSLMKADFEFLASAVSNALWGDDRYRDMRRNEFLIAVRRELGQVNNKG
jgi:hypothetical protein